MASSLLDGFTERMEAAGGRVTRSSRDDLAGAVAGLVDAARPVLLTPSLSSLTEELRAAGLDARVGTREAAAAEGEGTLEELLEGAGAGVVEALAGIASSGTLVVGPGGRNGGLLTAFPPHSVVIVKAETMRERMEEVLPEVVRRFAEVGGEVVFVSGPSRTADIEMMSVVGVHGPTVLDVVIVGAGPAPAEPAGEEPVDAGLVDGEGA